MESGNEFLDLCDTCASRALNVLIAYENLAAGQRAMRLCCDLARQQPGDLSLQPRLWRLDIVTNPLCGGLAIADAVETDLFIVSTSSQVELTKAAQHWLKLCLAVARKRGTCAAVIALPGTDGQINEAYFLNLQFLRSLAAEAGVEFFAPFSNRKEDVRAKPTALTDVPGCLDEPGALTARQIAAPHQQAMLGAYDRDKTTGSGALTINQKKRQHL